MSVEFIDDLEKLRSMKPSQLLGYVRDILLDRAAAVKSLEESMIRLGHSTHWHPDAMGDHDGSAAAALALVKVLDVGKDQASRGVKLAPLVGDVVEVIRSCLIHEITLRQPDVGKPEAKPEEPGDVAA